MSDCIFCKIIAGEIPSATIYENDEFKVILDRFPSGEGHALILPKNHVPNVFEIDPAQAGRAYALAAKLARAMKEVLGFTDMNILQNNGPIAGQTVFHFHIHLIPRREGDGINVTWTPGEPTDEQIAAVQAKLTNKKDIGKSDVLLLCTEGFGKRSVSRPESAEGALPTRGKLCVSRFTDGTHQFILLSKQVENLFST